MQGKVKTFVTAELGELSMNISKQELLEKLQLKNIRCIETPRTVTLKDKEDDTIMYFIFSDDLGEIILVDLCDTELLSINIDDNEYEPEFIKELKENEQIKRINEVDCDYKNCWVRLNKDMDCNCSTGINRLMCSSAGCIRHEVTLEKSIITYIDFGESTDNKMFCIENNHGKHVDYIKIQREEKEKADEAKASKEETCSEMKEQV